MLSVKNWKKVHHGALTRRSGTDVLGTDDTVSEIRNIAREKE